MPGLSLVQYYVYTNPGPVPMGAGWIVDSMSKGSLPKTLQALRARAQRQAGLPALAIHGSAPT